MADSTIGKAYVQIIPSAEGITERLNELLGTSSYEAGKSAGASLGTGLLSALTEFGGKITGLMSGIVSEIGDMVNKSFSELSNVAAYGDNIDKMSQKMGLSAETYQEWSAVMQHSGTSMESMKASMKTLASAAENNNKAFEKLGITQADLEKMSQEELFEATIASLQELDDVTERTYLSGQLLGRGATELGALLNTSAEDTEAMKQRVHELGGVLSDETVKASAQFQDNMQDLQTALSGAKREIISEFLPSVNMLIDGFTRLTAGEEGANELLGKGITEFIKEFGTVSSAVLTSINDFMSQNSETVISGITELAGGVIKGIAAAFPDILNALTGAVPLISQALREIGAALVKNAPVLLNALGELVSELIRAGLDMLPDFISGAVSILSEVANTLAEYIPVILQTIVDALPEIGTALTEALPVLIEAAGQLIGALIEAFPDLLSGFVNALPEMLRSLLDALPVLIDTVNELLVKLGEMLPEILPILLPAVTECVVMLIESTADMLTNNIMPLLDTVIEVSVTLVKCIIDNIDLFVDCVWEIIKAVGRAIYDNAPELEEKLFALIEKLIDYLPELYNDLIEAGGDLIMKIADGFNSPEFKEAMLEWGDSVLETFETIWTDFKDFWGGLWSKFTDIGGDIIGGIWEGITAKWEELKEDISEFGDTVVETFCDIFDINSPSKIMKDLIGKNLALGIGEGFAAEIGGVSELIAREAEDSIGGSLTDVIPDVTAETIIAPTPASRAGNAVYPADERASASKNVIFNQTINSPKSVSRWDVYRDTKNLIGTVKGAL